MVVTLYNACCTTPVTQLLRDPFDRIQQLPVRVVDDTLRSELHGAVYAKHGYFVPDVEAFDHTLFRMGSGEVSKIDPHQRKLLEISYSCLVGHGCLQSTLQASGIGIFLGMASGEWAGMGNTSAFATSAYAITGDLLLDLSSCWTYLVGGLTSWWTYLVAGLTSCWTTCWTD